jgi:hypothetical protein
VCYVALGTVIPYERVELEPGVISLANLANLDSLSEFL